MKIEVARRAARMTSLLPLNRHTPGYDETAKLSARIDRTIQHYGFSDPAKAAWTGPVVRRDPGVVRQRSVHLTWPCPNEFCRQWTMNGAHVRGRCNFCDEPRGAT